jgi:hypothetical protein
VNLRCPKALPPALRSGPDGAHAVANPAFCAKAALANLGLPSRCGGLDPCWGGTADDSASDSVLALTDSI